MFRKDNWATPYAASNRDPTMLAQQITKYGQRDYLPSLAFEGLGKPRVCLGCGCHPAVGWLDQPWFVFRGQAFTPLKIKGALCPICVRRLCAPKTDALEFLNALQVACVILDVEDEGGDGG